MKQKTLGTLALFAAVLFGACGVDLSNNTTLPVRESVQEEIRLEPFDPAVFNAQRTAWETEHPDVYHFIESHYGPGMNTLGYSLGYPLFVTLVKNDIPEVVRENDTEFLLLCDTVSGLYEKLDTLWTEQRYTGDSFLIEYNGQRHYPRRIKIKNINDSGDDYKVMIYVANEIIVVTLNYSGGGVDRTPWWEKW
jgi:hypothetical protein